ncbi:alpha/beta hydrolase [Piscinibacter sp. XHJ-5]|uniref:alpha/beta fold hydrolase n=1 Tax=Piscinibacter sp. XHJ-5 TaxID=3037797 RepID=UPI002452EDBE|nr:alpha/beta hydrolase [Piscinibacter sp. XHJ-5]
MKVDVAGRSAYAYTGGKPFDPTLPCIVFLHGALHDHSAWTLLARWAAHHGHAVLAVDEPGHGRSEGPPLADVEALAHWTLALLDAADVRQAALVGHSMGSLIALEAAARAPERITRLVMIGTAYPMKVSDALLATAREAPLKAIDMVNALSFSSTAAKPSYPGPGAWLQGANRTLMRRIQAANPEINLFLHDFGVCDRYAHGFEAASQVRCPVQLIVGERDQMTSPQAARELAAALSARVATLPCGHSLMLESPDAVLNALRDALKQEQSG